MLYQLHSLTYRASEASVSWLLLCTLLLYHIGVLAFKDSAAL